MEHPRLQLRDRVRAKVEKIPPVYGPRGMILLSLAAMCFCFGLAYVGPVAVETGGPGLAVATMILPLPYWGVLWFVGAFHLLTSAFRVDQARAIGGVAGMLAAWGLSYMAGSIMQFMAGIPNRMWLSATAFLALMALVLGVARMLNLGVSHLEITPAPGPIPTPEEPAREDPDAAE